MYKFVILLALFGVARSMDFSLGTRDFSRKVLDEDRKASPALWRRSTIVAVVADEGEVVSGIFVTDRRPKKDGIVEIVEGGERQRTVVLKLKSPAVFRGYDFHVEIYTQPGPQPRAIPAVPAVEEDTPRVVPESNIPAVPAVEEEFPRVFPESNIPAEPAVEEETPRVIPERNQPRDIVENDLTPTTATAAAPIDDIVTPINVATEINAIDITENIPLPVADGEEIAPQTEQDPLPVLDLTA